MPSDDSMMSILPWDGETPSWAEFAPNADDETFNVVDDTQGGIVLDDPSSVTVTRGEPPTEEEQRARARKKTGGPGTVNLYVTVQRATDAEAIKLARRVKAILESNDELVAAGDGKF
jgi:hypothetical protein